jgi:hypothetical protein
MRIAYVHSERVIGRPPVRGAGVRCSAAKRPADDADQRRHDQGEQGDPDTPPALAAPGLFDDTLVWSSRIRGGRNGRGKGSGSGSGVVDEQPRHGLSECPG